MLINHPDVIVISNCFYKEVEDSLKIWKIFLEHKFFCMEKMRELVLERIFSI
ncbi:hypothetical protein H359_0690 [Chlamydia ibidis 10-1398/6]|uniref:Uncharacterized protein n=1 Tax=Chlamydia ibidis 10-1398/6 TaxID=1046581 RepID=A0ABN0MZE9_9CHLA|nr:hypothetical protein H359_0690 [Chlamydia ibidis 10-1398/6]